MTLANEAVCTYTIFTVHLRAAVYVHGFSTFRGKIEDLRTDKLSPTRHSKMSENRIPISLRIKSFLNVSICRGILNIISL